MKMASIIRYKQGKYKIVHLRAMIAAAASRRYGSEDACVNQLAAAEKQQKITLRMLPLSGKKIFESV